MLSAICDAPHCGPTHQFFSLNVQLLISTCHPDTCTYPLSIFLCVLYILLVLARIAFCFSCPTRTILSWFSHSLLTACSMNIICLSLSLYCLSFAHHSECASHPSNQYIDCSEIALLLVALTTVLSTLHRYPVKLCSSLMNKPFFSYYLPLWYHYICQCYF